jgi:A/G-specific adenine glycosylase
MLQQTRVAVVIPYYERFLTRFPSVRVLAAAPESEVLRLWSGLGYYTRARNLHRAAKMLCSQFKGRFPSVPEEALSLPGIGRYTAAAVLSMAYGVPRAVLDGNVARVLARLGAVRGDLRSPRRSCELQSRAQRLLAPESPGDWNQAMMELGATVCTPRRPSCQLCPLARFCRARARGLTSVIPEKRRKPAPLRIEVAAAVLLNPAGRTLLLKPNHSRRATRQANASDLAHLFSRLWQFPAVVVRCKARPDEIAVRAALRTHLRERLDLPKIARLACTRLGVARHRVTFRQITLRPYLYRVPRIPKLSHARSAPLDDLDRLPVSSATRKLARMALREDLSL